MSHEWAVRESVGDTATFHRLDPQPVRSATVHRVDRPTLVLGSSQSVEQVDHSVAAAVGCEVVPRRSGGGAVLLLPGEFVWLDLVVPAADPLWSSDVSAAMHWAGAMWASALADLGVSGTVHDGPMLRTTWSSQVCWAGVGAGEVLSADGRGKLVGISQRRTRGWARLQTMVHLRWRPELVAALVRAPRPAPSDLAGCAAVLDQPAAAVTAALLARLPR